MNDQRLPGRQLKSKILSLLHQDDFNQALAIIEQLPARQAVNPLFSFFYNSDEQIRWRAIIAMGVVVARLAETDPESARVVMRRLMWNLNDESGGIGWGSPEAMGEILARSPLLAEEFAHILVSYIREDMNYLEHEGLQRGVLWGLARLAESRPDLIRAAGPYLHPYIKAPDPILRGLAARTIIALDDDTSTAVLARLADDQTQVRVFMNNRLVESTVAELAMPSDKPKVSPE